MTYVRFSADGRYIVACGYSKTGEQVQYSCVLWDADTRDLVQIFEGQDPSHELTGHAIISKDGTTVTALSKILPTSSPSTPAKKGIHPYVLVRWDVATGEEIERIRPPRSDVYTIAVSRDQKWYVGGVGAKQVGRPKGHFAVWDTVAGKLLKQTACSMSSLASVAVAPGKRHVVAGGYDGELEIWDLRTGKRLFHRRAHADTVSLKGTVAIRDMVLSVAVSPDGQHAASAGFLGDLKMWRLSPFSEVWSRKIKDTHVRSLAFSPDRKLFVGCSDGTLKAVDPAKGRTLVSLRPGRDDVVSLNISTDGQYVAAGLGNGRVYVYSLSLVYRKSRGIRDPRN